MELEDLAFSGIQEFARQWLLINHREPYEPGTGTHKLWLSAGGSVGHGGLWAVDIEEGVLQEDFGGRVWGVTVTGAGAARQAMAERGDAKKQEKQARQDKSDDAAVLSAVDTLMRPKMGPPTAKAGSGRKRGAVETAQPPPTARQIRAQSRLSPDRATRAVSRLLDAGLLEEAIVTVMTGTNNKVPRTFQGYRRKASTTTDGLTVGTDGQDRQSVSPD
jgi:hypothetical protein